MATDLHALLAATIMEELVSAFKSSSNSSALKSISTTLMDKITSGIKNSKISSTLSDEIIMSITNLPRNSQFNAAFTQLSKYTSSQISYVVNSATTKISGVVSKLADPKVLKDTENKLKAHTSIISKLYEKLPPGIQNNPTARATLQYLDTLEVKARAFGSSLSGAIGESSNVITSFISKNKKFIAFFTGATIAAADLQSDLKRIIVQNTGLDTTGYNQVYRAVNNISASTGLAQNQVIGLATSISDAGLMSRQLDPLNHSLSTALRIGSDMVRTFGYLPSEVGLIMASMNRVGVNTTTVKGLNAFNSQIKEAHTLGTKYNLTVDEIKNSVINAATVMQYWGMSGVASSQMVITGLIHAQGLYKEMGLSTDAIKEKAKNLGIYSKDTITTISMMSSILGLSFKQLDDLKKQDFGEFLLKQQEALVTSQSSMIKDWQQNGNMGAQMAYLDMAKNMGVSQEEALKIAASFQASNYSVTDMTKKIRDAAKQQVDADKAMKGVNESWSTVMKGFASIGQSLLILVGEPILKLIAIPLNLVAKGLQLLAGTATDASNSFSSIFRPLIQGGVLLFVITNLSHISKALWSIFTLSGKFTGLLSFLGVSFVNTGIAIVGFLSKFTGLSRVLAPYLISSRLYAGSLFATFRAGFEWMILKLPIVGKLFGWVTKLGFLKNLLGFIPGIGWIIKAALILWPLFEWLLDKFFPGLNVWDALVSGAKSFGSAIKSTIMAPFEIFMKWIDKIRATYEYFKGVKKEKGWLEAGKEVIKYTAVKSSPILSKMPDSQVKAIDAKIGALSAQYESSRKGSAAIGVDSTGGASYGKYQLSSLRGSVTDFIKYAKNNNPQIYNQLAPVADSAADKNGAFAKKWLELSKSSQFSDLEHSYVKKTYYDPSIKDGISKGLNPNISNTLKDVFWSRSVQLGTGNFSQLLRGLGDLSKIPEDELIKKIYDKSGNYFTKNTAAERVSVLNRFELEKTQALNRLAAERNQSKTQTPVLSTGKLEGLLTALNNTVSSDVQTRKAHIDYVKIKDAGSRTSDYGMNSMIANGVT